VPPTILKKSVKTVKSRYSGVLGFDAKYWITLLRQKINFFVKLENVFLIFVVNENLSVVVVVVVVVESHLANSLDFDNFINFSTVDLSGIRSAASDICFK
jgi:hypothetical protein